MLMSNCGLTLDEAKQRVRNHYSRDDEMPTERDLEYADIDTLAGEMVW